MHYSSKLRLGVILLVLVSSACATKIPASTYKVVVPILTYPPVYRACNLINTKTLEKEEAQCVVLYAPDYFELITELKAGCLAAGQPAAECQVAKPQGTITQPEPEAALKQTSLVAKVAFRDTISCTVQGFIFGAGGEVGFTQETCQHAIRFEHSGDSVVLYSPHVWVRVQYPLSGGNQRFQYQWAKDHALINGKVVPIDWGYVLTG